MRGNTIKKRLMNGHSQNPNLQASSSPIPRIRKQSIGTPSYHTAGVSINARSFSTNRKSDMELDG